MSIDWLEEERKRQELEEEKRRELEEIAKLEHLKLEQKTNEVKKFVRESQNISTFISSCNEYIKK